MGNLVGRKKERDDLQRLYASSQAQLVAIYGRLRVGKTFLVDEVFKGKTTFRHSGLSPIKDNGSKNHLEDQLQHFSNSLRMHGMEVDKTPGSWLDAFYMLAKFLQDRDDGRKQVVFLGQLGGDRKVHDELTATLFHATSSPIKLQIVRRSG